MLDVFEALFPLGRQLGAAQRRVDQADQGHSFRRSVQLLALTLDITGADQFFDDLGARSRRAQPGLLHRGREGVVFDLATGILHGRQEGRIIIVTRRLGLLLLHLQAVDGQLLSLHQWRQDA